MKMNKTKIKLNEWRKNGLLRVRRAISSSHENKIMINASPAINFSSNDYLGLSKHPKISEAMTKGIHKYGLGSGASALVSGYYDAQEEFENGFARWLGIEKAILFSSGYMANIGAITALADRGSVILSDKLCHASILDGIQLSRANHYRFVHNSILDLSRLIQLKVPDLIITESVFSIEGSLSPISDITSLADYRSIVIVDDAHGIGVLGGKGRGILEYTENAVDKIDCLIAPLGKAFNAVGGVVAGKREIIEGVLQFARTCRYTTALPPAIASALLETLKVVNDESWRRERLLKLIEFFIGFALSSGLVLSSEDKTPIKSILIGDNGKALQLQEFLLANGFYVSCIRPPTVSKNRACLRISLNCLHSESDIERLIDLIKGSNI